MKYSSRVRAVACDSVSNNGKQKPGMWHFSLSFCLAFLPSLVDEELSPAICDLHATQKSHRIYALTQKKKKKVEESLQTVYNKSTE